MGQHFLRSSAYRNFTIHTIYAMSDEDIHQLFARLRWGSQTHQVCPSCGVWDRHYVRQSRWQWRCRACRRDFSVTSATVFANRKKSLRTLLLVAFHYVTAAKGIAALALCRVVDYSSKTAFVTLGKCRESILRTQDLTPLTGVVEIDGGYFGGKPRKPNRRGRRNHQLIADRIAGRRPKRPWHASGMTRTNWQKRKNKRVVMVLRQQGAPGEGASRTIVAVTHSENERDVTELVQRYVAADAVIMTDENPAFASLSATREHYAVSHSVEYVSPEGVNDNQAESYYSRLRRSEYGVLHGIRPTYLADYACEMAWREDVRRCSIKHQVEALLTKALTLGHSCWWRGYYQGKRRDAEILMNQGVPRPRRSGGRAQ